MRKLWKQRCITHKAVLTDSVNKVVLFLKALKSKYANFRSTSQFLWIERSRTCCDTRVGVILLQNRPLIEQSFTPKSEFFLCAASVSDERA